MKTKQISKSQPLANPTNNTKKPNYRILLAISYIIIAFILSILFYNFIPDPMITHWGLNGEANGYTPKEAGIWFVPLVMTGILIILYYVPKLDPLSKNIDGFRKEYHTLIAVITGFFLYLQIISIALNLGINLDIRQLLSPAFAALVYSTGSLIKRTKRNFFIGIRTPWTLNSDLVWEKTHNKAAKLFKASAILSLIGLFVPELAFFFIIVPLLLASLGVIIYSYIEYKKETKSKKKVK